MYRLGNFRGFFVLQPFSTTEVKHIYTLFVAKYYFCRLQCSQSPNICEAFNNLGILKETNSLKQKGLSFYEKIITFLKKLNFHHFRNSRSIQIQNRWSFLLIIKAMPVYDRTLQKKLSYKFELSMFIKMVSIPSGIKIIQKDHYLNISLIKLFKYALFRKVKILY